MKREERYYRKIDRYKEKKVAFENLKANFKSLLGINKETIEDVEIRYEGQSARQSLSYLIWHFIWKKSV